MLKLTFLEDAAKDLDQWMTGRTENRDPLIAQDMVSIINDHALATAAASAGVSLLPGAGSTAALVAATGILWHMYLRISDRVGLKLSRTVLKSLATAVLSNIAQAAMSIVGTVVLSTLLSLTGVGAIPSAIMMAALDYAIVLVGGVIYLKVLTGLFHAGKDPEEMTEEDLKLRAEDTISREHVGDMLRQARNAYKNARMSGEVTGKETVDMDEQMDVQER